MAATFLAFLRMILVLGSIIGSLLLFAKIAKKRQLSGGRRLGGMPLGQIEVLSRRALGQHMALLIIRVAGRTFLIGQSSQQFTLITEISEEEWTRASSFSEIADRYSQNIPTPGKAPGSGKNYPGAWDAFIDRLREMTVRH